MTAAAQAAVFIWDGPARAHNIASGCRAWLTDVGGNRYLDLNDDDTSSSTRPSSISNGWMHERGQGSSDSFRSTALPAAAKLSASA